MENQTRNTQIARENAAHCERTRRSTDQAISVQEMAKAAFAEAVANGWDSGEESVDARAGARINWISRWVANYNATNG